MSPESEQIESARGVPFGANAVRLSPKQCCVAAVLLVILFLLIPQVWPRLEPLDIGPGYRIPYTLSEDYWLYNRYASVVASDAQAVPIIGDSVVWGQYTAPEGTLSQALNRALGRQDFANLGLNGGHPAALSGLIQHYAGSIKNRRVLLHFNPLWMTSKRRDLQSSRATRFNHPNLVPQIFSAIPSYDETIANRLSIAIEQRVTFLSWMNHLRIAYFENEDFPSWTTGHPYANPARQLTLRLPQPALTPPSDPVPWTEKEARLQAFSWVSVEESLQWRFFQRSLNVLRSRNNEVFVLVGPLNEHMLTEASRATYRALREDITAWLDAEHIAYFSPEALPSDLYADTSHPLAEGYALWASRLREDEGFRTFLGARD